MSRLRKVSKESSTPVSSTDSNDEKRRQHGRPGLAITAGLLLAGGGAFGYSELQRSEWKTSLNKANQNESAYIDTLTRAKGATCISKIVLLPGAKVYSTPEILSKSILLSKTKSNLIYTVPKHEEVASAGSWVPSNEYKGWAPVNIVSSTEAANPTFYKAIANTNNENIVSSPQIASQTDWTPLYAEEGSSIAVQTNTGQSCYINKAGETVLSGTSTRTNYAITMPFDSAGDMKRMFPSQ